MCLRAFGFAPQQLGLLHSIWKHLETVGNSSIRECLEAFGNDINLTKVFSLIYHYCIQPTMSLKHPTSIRNY